MFVITKTSSELSDRILEAMHGAGLKKLQLAKATGKSSGAVTQWIDGTTKTLKAETAAKLQAATGYSAVWLVTGKGEKLAGSNTPNVFDALTPGALDIAALYDLIPVRDQIRRVEAYNAATAAILAVLKPFPAISQAPVDSAQPRSSDQSR